MDVLTIGKMVAGLVLLVAGAEGLVRGASRLASTLGISSLVIGLTIVSIGTGSPEIAVSVQAAATGAGSLAIGNVVGSNIFNLLFILGMCGVITTTRVANQLVRFDVPVLLGGSALLYVQSLDARLDLFPDGILLLVLLVAYMVLTYRIARADEAKKMPEHETVLGKGIVGSTETEAKSRLTSWRGWLFNGGLILVGIVLLVLGANWLVEGAVAIATALRIDPLVIGLTIVAAGTGLPEAATSIVAAMRGERDIAVGNAIGSSVFNIFGVLGLSVIFAQGSLIVVDPVVVRFDIPVMIGATLLCLPVFVSGFVVRRLEGTLFLMLYVAYTTFLVLKAVQSDGIDEFTDIMEWGVFPMLALLVVIMPLLAWRDWREQRRLRVLGEVAARDRPR